MPKQRFDTYWRGLLTRPHPRGTPQGYCRDAVNFFFRGGIPVSRPGIKPYHGKKLSGPCRGIGIHVLPTAVRQTLSASGAAFERVPRLGDPVNIPLTSMPSTMQTRLDPTAGCRFLSLSGGANLTLIFDGVNPNLKWDGTALTVMGIEPTTTPPAPPTPSGGNKITKGTRQYVQTLLSPYSESNPSDPKSVTMAGPGAKTFASPVNGVNFDDPQVTQWKLWRTQKNGAAYFFVGEADIGVAIVDNVADETLDEPLEEFVNRREDQFFTTMCEHKGRVFGVTKDDESIVKFSNIHAQYMSPEAWPKKNQFPIAHGDGDRVAGIESFFEWIVVFKENASYAITGDAETGFNVIPVMVSGSRLRQGVGCVSPGSILHLGNAIQFMARDGIYVIERWQTPSGGIIARRISEQIDETYNCTNFSLGAAAIFDRQQRISVFFGHG